jgi:hypothetical protein
VSPREKGFGKRWRLHATQKTPSNGLALFARQRLAFFNAVLMTTLSCSNTTVDQGGHELPTTAGILFLTREFANKTRFISVRAETKRNKNDGAELSAVILSDDGIEPLVSYY